MTGALITFLLDRTGSMESIKDDTIGAFNAYIGGFDDDDDIEFSLIQFDSQSLDKVCVRSKVKDVPRLNKNNYVPRASTPLIDAAYKTIKAVEAGASDKDTKIIICIQTDGQENSSTEYSWDELNALIKEKTALGWQFNFMGAGIDAYKIGNLMGVSTRSTMSYDRASSGQAFAAASRTHVGYARGEAAATDFSMDEKAAAGDVHANANDPRAKGVQQSKPTTPQPQRKSERKAAVDDFNL